MELELRYQAICQRFAGLSDFTETDLKRSRQLFHLTDTQIVPRHFEVWTCLVGLPLPKQLTQNFQTIVQQITEQLPATTRFYSVLPQNYHWELFIIKRPQEIVEPEHLQQIPTILEELLAKQPPLTISYRGFLITPDGTIIVKGYGNFDQLRTQLCTRIPFASPQQSNLGHVSLGRILDSVGSKAFCALKSLVQDSWDDYYGELPVREVKYVHESQWYMEEQEIIASVPCLGC
ncbi:MAG: hypothetical protein F6J86_26955 [Symploca sp. SIO1B1]|nr:hypothetical protein [Symploca sp. SIO1B1]